MELKIWAATVLMFSQSCFFIQKNQASCRGLQEKFYEASRSFNFMFRYIDFTGDYVDCILIYPIEL